VKEVTEKETRQERREEKRRKKKERIKMHGKSIARIYADVVRKRAGKK
jgi:hypothetical protein